MSLLFRRHEMRQRELDEEIRAHLAMAIRERIAQGEDPAEAEENARREFGNVPLVKEVTQDMWGKRWLDALRQDLQYGLRQLRRSPGFTAVAIITLALGIGATTAIFSLMNAVMLRQLPVERPGQLVLLGHGELSGISGDTPATELFSYPFYRSLKKSNTVFTSVCAVFSDMFSNMHGLVEGSASLEPVNVQLVSGSYFSMLGVKPVIGRALMNSDDVPAGGHPVAVASYSWWQRRFSRNPSVLGKTVTLGSTVYTIIGVAPPEFFGMTVGQSPDLWIPLSMEKQVSPGMNGLGDDWFQSLYIFGRLKPGVSMAAAQASVNLQAHRLWSEFLGSAITNQQQENLRRHHIELTSTARGLSHLRFKYSPSLKILMALVVLLLLIVCANIAGLLMARATARQREIAVRLAVGAGRMRLIRQMLTEGLLLALCGGALGVLIAWWGSGGLLVMVSAGREPFPLNVVPDGRVLAFAFIVSLATAILFATLPALRATRMKLAESLKDSRGEGSHAGRGVLAKSTVIFQAALSLVLLIGAALFARTLVNLDSVNAGFDKQHVLLFEVDPAAVGYKEDSRLVNLYREIERRVKAEPGVKAASVSFFTFNQGSWTDEALLAGRPATPTDDYAILNNIVGPGYFSTMGVPVLAGRIFGMEDSAKSPKVAIINETMAKRYFPGGSPVGRHFGLASEPKAGFDIEVIGVVKDAKSISLEQKPFPAVYYPYTQRAQFLYDLAVRYSGDQGAIISEVRHAVREAGGNLPLAYHGTLSQQVDRSVTGQRLVARLSSFFGLLAVFLASIGIYGLMSYTVARRTNEIGIRMALGAGRSRVLRMVMRESMMLAGAGIAIGLPIALAGGRLVSSLLFGLGPSDPVAIASAALVLAGVAGLASYFPARRAARVDPMQALRAE